MQLLFQIFDYITRFVVLGLALAFVLTQWTPDLVRWLRAQFGVPTESVAIANAPAALPTPVSVSNGPVSYADAVMHAAPTVVNIYANKIITTRQYRTAPDPVLQRLFGNVTVGPAYRRREQSLGSGVIVSTEGYVLTNNHVISGANDIQVLLDDDRVAQAKVVGTDAETDLAVLKIDIADLPFIAIADRAPVNVGDVVLAIGNPFGIGKTVTMGIVSATGRQLKLSAYEDFIQTDAPINTGNSGGALVNAVGELVGINTAIFRQNASAEGIGFAIPVNTAKAVLDQIIAHGVVIRGWFGAEYTDLPSSVRKEANAPTHGVVVLEIYPGGPAAQAGIQPGDILLRLGAEEIADQAELRNREAVLSPGDSITLDVLRGESTTTLTLNMAQRPPMGRTTGT